MRRLILLVGLAGVGLRAYLRRNDPVVFVLASSGILYELTYFFLAPAPDIRYSLWIVVAAILAGAYAYAGRRFAGRAEG